MKVHKIANWYGLGKIITLQLDTHMTTKLWMFVHFEWCMPEHAQLSGGGILQANETFQKARFAGTIVSDYGDTVVAHHIDVGNLQIQTTHPAEDLDSNAHRGLAAAVDAWTNSV